MKMNKKGFTLIELLAVIVILAVIALIAVPQILKILNDARRSAAEDSAYGVLETTESYVATWMLNNQGDWNGATKFICKSDTKKCCEAKLVNNVLSDTEVTENCLEVKGTAPKSGIIILDEKGEATIDNTHRLQINNFWCKQDNDKVKCSTNSAD